MLHNTALALMKWTVLVATLGVQLSVAAERPRILFSARLENVPAPVAGKWPNLVSARKWYGLYCSDGGCRLRETRVMAQSLQTQDCNGRRVPGSLLSFQPAGPLFVVDTRWRPDGEVPTALHDPGGREVMSGGVTPELLASYLGSDIALAIPVKPVANDACSIQRPIPLEMVADGALQTRWMRNACPVPSGMAGEFAVHWIGDLDGDGKWDALIRYPQGTYALLLSAHPAQKLEFSYSLAAEGC
jgi:hypothetical protein